MKRILSIQLPLRMPLPIILSLRRLPLLGIRLPKTLQLKMLLPRTLQPKNLLLRTHQLKIPQLQNPPQMKRKQRMMELKNKTLRMEPRNQPNLSLTKSQKTLQPANQR